MGFLIALAIILLILFLKVGVRVRVRDELRFTVGVGIFRLTVFPAKEKTIKLSDYKIKRFRRDRARLEKREAAKKRKRDLKERADTKASTAEKVEEARRLASGEKKEKRDIMGLVSTLKSLAATFLSRFGRHLHIKVRRVVITIGTEDAASTAVLYGAVCGAVQCLLELLYNCMHLKFTRTAEVRVDPDFTSEKIQAEVDIAFSFRVWQLFDMLIRTGFAFLKNNNK